MEDLFVYRLTTTRLNIDRHRFPHRLLRPSAARAVTMTRQTCLLYLDVQAAVALREESAPTTNHQRQENTHRLQPNDYEKKEKALLLLLLTQQRYEQRLHQIQRHQMQILGMRNQKTEYNFFFLILWTSLPTARELDPHQLDCVHMHGGGQLRCLVSCTNLPLNH